MMWISLLIALVLSLAALAYVVWPLLKPGPAPILVEEDRLTELLGRKDTIMKAIKDLEFDYHVGKLSDEDFQLYDQRLRRQAVGLLQQIEQVAPMGAGLDAALEAEVTRRRRVQEPGKRPIQPATVALAAAPVVAAPAVAAPVAVTQGAERYTAGETTNGGGGVRFCTNCGHKLDTSHKFCANCGMPAAA